MGFSALPEVGVEFQSIDTKKEAEAVIAAAAGRVSTSPRKSQGAVSPQPSEEDAPPPQLAAIVIKTDVAGAGEAVMHEISKMPAVKDLELRILATAVGSINENDVRLAGSGEIPGVVLGLNVKVDAAAVSLAERLGVSVKTFEVIYLLPEWLGGELERRRPRERVEEKVGVARVLKIFSTDKKSIVLGGRVEEGVLSQRAEVRIMRRDLVLGSGIIESLQSQKKTVREVEAGSEFGALVRTPVVVAAGDMMEIITVVMK